MPRTINDIARIRIDTQVQGRAGWLVSILYTDGKMAEFTIDYDYGPEGMDMLARAFKCIRLQLASKQQVAEDA